VVEEPGRRIVREELAGDGAALPWVDPAAFARRAVAMALADRAAAEGPGGLGVLRPGLVDAAAALEHATGEAVLEPLGRTHRYHRRVFLAPPWPEIYVNDPERPHGFEAARAEYERLLSGPMSGWTTRSRSCRRPTSPREPISCWRCLAV
jgi:predicted ATPase